MPVSYFPQQTIPSQTAEVPPVLLWKLADELSEVAVQYKEEPFQLRAGGQSHWYIDGRGPVAMHRVRGPLIARLALAKLNVQDLRPQVVTGMGVGGLAFAMNIRCAADMDLAQANDSREIGQRYGYGLHGASVHDTEVLVVDDTLSTGDSLITTIDMVREAGGRVVRAVTIFDRSDGLAAERIQTEHDVPVDWLFGFYEADGKLFPNI